MKRKSKRRRAATTREALAVSSDATEVAAGLIVILGALLKFGPALSPIPASTILVPYPGGSIDLGSLLLVLGIVILLVFSLVSVKRVRRRSA